jgi:hypothetical protein
MSDRYPPALQREALAVFAAALGSASSALRRDECGDPRLNGKRCYIYAVPEGFQFYCVCDCRLAWTWELSFAKVTQDGDEEGMLLLDRLPTAEEAEAIRDYLGIAKRPDLSEEERERRRSFGLAFAKKFPFAGGVALLPFGGRGNDFSSRTGGGDVRRSDGRRTSDGDRVCADRPAS